MSKKSWPRRWWRLAQLVMLNEMRWARAHADSKAGW